MPPGSGQELVVREPVVERLPSEDVVVSAPMSFRGSAARIWKLTHREPQAAWTALAVALVGTDSHLYLTQSSRAVQVETGEWH